MCDFISRRLMQLEPVGAILIVSGWHRGYLYGNFAVSTINLANHLYTRVHSPTHDLTWHYPGVIDTHTAANDAAGELYLLFKGAQA